VPTPPGAAGIPYAWRSRAAIAVATQVGSGTFLVPLQGSSFGFDFNPTVDRIRIVSDANQRQTTLSVQQRYKVVTGATLN
jgi:hypothetical protein